jgi:hypothetical protein
MLQLMLKKPRGKGSKKKRNLLLLKRRRGLQSLKLRD